MTSAVSAIQQIKNRISSGARSDGYLSTSSFQTSDSNPFFGSARYSGSLRGVYHRARIRATRWLAMTLLEQGTLLTRHCEERSDEAIHSFLRGSPYCRETLAPQQSAERAAHQRAADRTADPAAHRFAEVGHDPADHLVADRARAASPDDLPGRH